MSKEKKYYLHESSYVDDNVKIKSGTKIWHFSHIQTGAMIGKNCSIGQNVNIGNNVVIGNDVILYPKAPPGWFIGINSRWKPFFSKNSRGS